MAETLELNVNIIPKMDAVDAALKKIENKPIISKLPGQSMKSLLSKWGGRRYEKPPKTMRKEEISTGDPFAAFKGEKTQVGKVHVDSKSNVKNQFDALKKWSRVFKIDLFWKWIKGTWNVLLRYVPLLKSLTDILDAALSLILTALLLPFLPEILAVLKGVLKASADFFKWMKENGEDVKNTFVSILSILEKGIVVKLPTIAAEILPKAAATGEGGIGKVFTVFKNKLYKFIGILNSLIPKEFKEAFKLVMNELDNFVNWIKTGAEKLLKPLTTALDDIAKSLGEKAGKLFKPITDIIETKFGPIITKIIGEGGLGGLSIGLGKILTGALSLANVALWGSLVGDIFAVIGQIGEWVFTDILDIPILAEFFDTIKEGGQFFSEFLNVFDWVIAALKDLYSLLTGGPMGALDKKLKDVGKSLGEFGESIFNPRKKDTSRALAAMALDKDTRDVTDEELAEWKKTHPAFAAAKGGIFTQPTNALIGEAGPEAVIPLDQMKGMGGTSITINGLVDEYKFRSIVREEIEKSNRRLSNSRGAVSI